MAFMPGTTCIILQCGSQHISLARLCIRVPHATRDPHLQTDQEDALALHQRLHCLMQQAQKHLPEELACAAVATITSSTTMQYACHKSVVAKLYKALATLQHRLGFVLDDVRTSISLQPVCLRELDQLSSAAVAQGLLQPRPPATAAGDGDLLSADRHWWALRPGCFVSANVLQAAPGVLCHALRAELDVTAQQPDKVLLTFSSAGAIKYRLYSITHALQADRCGSLPSELHANDTDADILGDPNKLRAANKLVHGRACCVLPYLTPAVIIKIHPSPAAKAALDQLQHHWLLHYGMQLPGSIPFLVEVAAAADSDDSLMAPSCCVLTSLGFASVPHNAPAYVSPQRVQQCVAADICSSRLQLWGCPHLAPVAPDSQPAAGAPGVVAASCFSYAAGWTSAKQLVGQDTALLQMDAVTPMAAPGSPGRGLEHDAAGRAAGPRRTQPRPARDYADLKAFLAKQQQQQQEQQAGDATSSRPVAHFRAGKPAAARPPAMKANTAGVLQTRPAAAPTRPSITPAAPVFKKSSAAGGAAAKPKQAGKRPLQAAARQGAALQPAASAAPADSRAPKVPKACAGVCAAATTFQATARPQQAAAAPGAAECRVQHAAGPCGSLPATALTSAALPVPTAGGSGSALASAAAPGAAAAAAAPGAAAAAAPPPPPPAAARKRVKAGDLDLEEVTSKLRAAAAAGTFKGVSVPQLQCYLKAHKLGVSGKKAELEARVVAHMSAATPTSGQPAP